MKKNNILFAIILVLALPHAYAANQYLCNYLGQGTDPNLSITLKNNGGQSWGTYTAGYGNCTSSQGAGIPTNPGINDKWSVWNITDEKGNYYGTVTLNNDAKVSFTNYSNDQKNGYYIEGIDFKVEPKQASQWIISVKGKIIRPDSADSGPFPNTPLATPAVYANDKTTPFILKVEGHNIVDNNGNLITLKGFARPSLEWNEQGQFLSEQDFANMKKWGANTIRLSLNQASWFKSKTIDVKGSYKQIIDAIIYQATQKGMVVILDLHWTKGNGQPNMADKDSIRFWKEVATQYKSFGTVLFELFNEPVNINKDVWLSGNAVYSGYQELYNAIASTGAKNICIINGLEWGFNLAFLTSGDQYKYAVKGENIVYGSHPYKRSYESIYSSLAGVVNKYPMLFTEFGDNDPKDYPHSFASAYINTLLFLNQYNGNYTAWAWWVSLNDPAFPTLISDWKNATPINGGVLVKDDMEKNPATVLPITSK
jgi:hypothetical protein